MFLQRILGRDSASAALRPRTMCTGLVGALARDTRGMTAVEFGIIVVPFLGLLLALLQVGLSLFTSEGLDVAVQAAARNLYTGTAQNGGISTASAFSAAYICPASQPRMLPSYVDCSKLIIDVRTTSNFTSADLAPDFYKTATMFCPGSPGDIVVVRIIYPLPAIVPVIGRTSGGGFGVLQTGLVNDVPGNGGWKQLLLGTAVFQNEPYDGSTYVPPAGC